MASGPQFCSRNVLFVSNEGLPSGYIMCFQKHSKVEQIILLNEKIGLLSINGKKIRFSRVYHACPLWKRLSSSVALFEVFTANS